MNREPHRRMDIVNLIIMLLVGAASFLSVRAFNSIDQNIKDVQYKNAQIYKIYQLGAIQIQKVINQVEIRLERLEERVDPAHPQAPLEGVPILIESGAN